MMKLSSLRFDPDRMSPAIGPVPIASPGETPFEPFDGSPQGRSRALTEERARRLLEAKIKFVPHPSFDDPAMHPVILGPAPTSSGGRAAPRVSAPTSRSPYLAGLDVYPLLTREQEAHQFRKMNFLKHQAARLKTKINPAKAKDGDLDLVESLQAEALAVQNQIIHANLRLVVLLVKKLMRLDQDPAELVSDGYVALLRAIENFDFSRGSKFSTYASWVINTNLRYNSLRNQRRDRLVTCHEAILEAAPDHRTDERQREAEHERRLEAIRGILGWLNDRERKIIVSRFGLEGTPKKTLVQLGKELGITKARVGQLENRARDKLRVLAEAQRLDLLAF
jgi:RNA polymerase primary sigma factor